jgi:hypothetical protein
MVGRAAEERHRALARLPQDNAPIHDYNVRSALRRRPSHAA